MWRHRGFNVYKLPPHGLLCLALIKLPPHQKRWLWSTVLLNSGSSECWPTLLRFESLNRQSFFLVQPSITLHKNHFEDGGHAWYMTQNYPAKREVVEITQTWWLIQVFKSRRKIKHLQRHLTPWHFEPTCNAHSINAPHPLNSPTSGNSFLLPLNVSQVLTLSLCRLVS